MRCLVAKKAYRMSVNNRNAPSASMNTHQHVRIDILDHEITNIVDRAVPTDCASARAEIGGRIGFESGKQSRILCIDVIEIPDQNLRITRCLGCAKLTRPDRLHRDMRLGIVRL